MTKSKYAQLGVITDPSPYVEYLVFEITNKDTKGLKEAIKKVFQIEQNISKQDDDCDMSVAMGFSSNSWDTIFTDISKPKELHSFIELEDGNRKFPATKGDVFFMIKSTRMDLNFQVAKYIKREFDPYAQLIEDVQGYKYLDSRDMIDFVDGTENPEDDVRLNAVLVDDDIDIHQGGSYLILQKYIAKDNLKPWDAKPVSYQEKVIGRTKSDNVEFSKEDKPAWAHTAKSPVRQADGKEIKMFRQNRPFGNAKEHGTMFVGFASSPKTIETSLKQMIIADENGDYDRLLDFVEAKTGNIYFMPSSKLLNQLAK